MRAIKYTLQQRENFDKKVSAGLLTKIIYKRGYDEKSMGRNTVS